MKRRRQHPQHRISRDSERLVWLAQGLAESGSRIEDAYWEAEIGQLVEKLLAAGQEDALNQAMDRLYETNARAYDELADILESATEGKRMETREGVRSVLLIALPVLAWSRYVIPARSLPDTVLASLRVHLAAQALAVDVQLALADYLFSPDQLPRGYAETRRFAETLWEAALADVDLELDADSIPESGQYISDVRYVMGAVAVVPGRPVFRWNEGDGSRHAALAQWQEQGGPHFQSVMPGCGLALVLPDAYYAAWRRADRDGRPWSLRAAVAYLHAVLGVPAPELTAVAAPFYDRRLEEWRIGFSRDDNQVLHGVVWPMLGAEDETADSAGEIEQALKAAGVGEVQVLDQHFALEYCEDCGAPLYPNANGDAVHAEMPEQEGDGAPMHLH